MVVPLAKMKSGFEDNERWFWEDNLGKPSQIRGDKIGSEVAVMGWEAVTTGEFLFYRDLGAIKVVFVKNVPKDIAGEGLTWEAL